MGRYNLHSDMMLNLEVHWRITFDLDGGSISDEITSDEHSHLESKQIGLTVVVTDGEDTSIDGMFSTIPFVFPLVAFSLGLLLWHSYHSSESRKGLSRLQ